MSEKSEKNAQAATVEGITAVAVAWMDLTNLLIKTNVIKIEDMQNLMARNIEVAKSNDHTAAMRMFEALSGGLNRE